MHFRARVGMLTLALAVVLLTAQPLTAQTMETFDDFTSAEIDGSRWLGTEHTIRYGSHPGGWSNTIETRWAVPWSGPFARR